MPSLCHNLSSHYAHLRTLTDAFTTQYDRVKDSGDLTEVRKLKVQLEEAREALAELLFIFRVPYATNPYHEALLIAGLDRTITQEKQDVIVDIRQEIIRQLEVYREAKDAGGKPLLQDWITNISENEGLIFAEVVKDRAKIRERIKAGMIPIVMPSRSVQERTWQTAFSSLKPVWFRRGKKVTLEDCYWHERYNEKMNQMDFFNDIPDRPYLVWVQPTQNPLILTPRDARVCASPAYSERVYNAQLVTSNPALYDMKDVIPTEYGALQTMFTSRVKEHYGDLKGITSEPIEIRPLDWDASTRFLSAGSFFGGRVPSAYFSNLSYRMNYVEDGSDAEYGFRPVSRT